MFWILIFTFAKTLSFALDPYPFEEEKGQEEMLLDQQPTQIVGGMVNALTGAFYDQHEDLVVTAPEPIVIVRSYSSRQRGQGALKRSWHLNHQGWIDLKIGQKPAEGMMQREYGAKFRGPSGEELLFFGDHHKQSARSILTLHKKWIRKCFCNTSGNEISGRTNLKNTRFIYQPHHKNYKIVTGSGAELIFHPVHGKNRELMVLKEHHLPNRNCFLYLYTPESYLARIISANAEGKMHAAVHILYPKDFEKFPEMHLQGSDGRKVSYYFTHISPYGYFLKEVVFPDETRFSYGYTSKGFPLLNKKVWPDGRQLTICYHENGKVHEILDQGVRLYTLTYEESHTTVTDAQGLITKYHFDENRRLTLVEKYDRKNICYGREKLFWHREGNLLSHSKETGEGIVYFAKTRAYDDRGNVLNEKHFGNFTGIEKEPLSLNSEGFPREKGCDVICIDRCFSNDGFNLLLQEKKLGVITHYSYQKGSDLLLRKKIEMDGKIIQRRFYTYDANCLLTKEIVDDGVGDHVDDLLEVTERMETCIIPRKRPPYGPIKERATFAHHLKTKERVLINKEVFFHTKEGWIRSLHTFNSQECPIQTRRWQYDVMGRKISETDPDGNTTYWKWNRVGLCQEENVGKRITSYSYDPRHTLKSIHTTFADAKTETTCYKRDLMGRVIEITDPLQEKTLLSYSPLGQEETISSVYQTKKMVWDDKGYLQELILPTGATVYQRNVRGQPTEISYPDGSKETLSYTLLGKVATHTTRHGAIVNYTYNNLGQCLKEITVSPEGDVLKKIFRRYNSFHLLEECQGEQHVTYHYDEAGRLIEKRCGELQEKYFYTPEGHLQKIRSLFDRTFSYDKSGRILSETTLSPSGELYKKRNYGYDTKGNCLFVEEANSQTLFKYNSKNEKILEIDPEKKMTRFKSEIVGHRRCQQITDPIQRLIETFTDGLGRPTMIAKFDPHSTPLFKQEITYEEGGKPDTITYKNDTSSYTIQYRYEPMGELSEKREGEKITTFRYNEHGLKSELIKPDGVSFHYSYDSLGRMIRQTSSDGTIDLSYTYDSLDHLVEATDHIHNITCKRKYDAQGNLIREELGNGLCLAFNYDPLSRLKEMILPDQSHALYVWEGPRLKKVVWKEHTHLFLRYDQRGNLLEEALIGLAGKRQAGYDVMGRLRCTEHKHFRAMIPPDGVDKAGRITKWLTNGGIQTFAYDSLDQLTQEEGAFHHHYTYDSFFNRLSIDQVPLSYANVFEMIKQGKTDCKYDANGNMIEKNGNTLTFDALDRLIRVETPKGTVTYTYDPFNRRLTRQVTSRQGQEFPKECFFWFQEMEIGSYMDQKCRSLRLLTPDKTRTLMMEIDGQAFAPLHDLRGHLIELIDPKTGELADETLYSAFGEQTKSFLSPWRFNEKRFDPETGFYYFGERYYDPELGRFITKDPLRESCGPNPFCFVKNNPIHFNDPIGLHHSSNPLRSTCEWIGNRIEWIGENLIPIPGVRDLVSCAGRLVSGKGLNGFVPSWQREGATEWYIGDEELSATTRIHTANGINVSFQEMVNRCQRWSERLNGARIHFTYIADKGIITNALEWFVHRLGIHTSSTKTLQNHLETLVSEVGTTGTIFNLVHSHAAECTSLIASHFRNRENDHIHSYTFGSPAMVSPTAYQKVVNFTSQRDPVTYLSPSRLMSLFTRRQEIIPLPPQGIPLLDHCLEGPTYLPALYATFADYLKASGAGR